MAVPRRRLPAHSRAASVIRSLALGIEQSGKDLTDMAGSMNSSQPSSARSADPDLGASRRRRRRRLPLWLASLRQHPYQVALVGALVEVLIAILLSRANHHDILGLAGAEAILVGLIAAVLAGPLAGLATTTAGAVAFWVFIS